MSKSDADIAIIDANENNLKNLSCKIPLNSIICINGVSGSGKTTLAKKLIVQEAERQHKIQSGTGKRYHHLVRGNFLSIKNLPKVLSIDQKPLLQSEKSTVATASGLNDCIRTSFVKYGIIQCSCGTTVEETPSYETIKKIIVTAIPDGNYSIYFYVSSKISSRVEKLIEFMTSNGFRYFEVDGSKKKYRTKDIETLNLDSNSKIKIEADSLDQLESLKIPQESIFILRNSESAFDFSYQTFCQHCMTEYQKKSLSLFTRSKLSDRNGCCNLCGGSGSTVRLNEKNLFYPKNNLAEGFLNLQFDGQKYTPINLYKSKLKKIIQDGGGKVSTTYESLPPSVKLEIQKTLINKLSSLENTATDPELIITSLCDECGGSGFSQKARAVKLNGRSVADILSLTIDEAFSSIRDPESSVILSAAQDLSLGHLVLNRSTTTLSGGEMQRIKLIEAITAKVSDLLIVIDEPSASLSSNDIKKLFVLLKRLQSLGNTLLLVDHSDQVISQSDFSIHLGPGSGLDGGYILETVDSVLPPLEPRKKCSQEPQEYISLRRISFNNVVNQDVCFPAAAITAIVGDSGSGKSSLVQGITSRITSSPRDAKANNIATAILLDQKHIRGSRRSNVSTFLDISEILRKLYSETVVAQALNLDSSFFTYNGANGACSECQGSGELAGETCKSCGGTRFNSLALSAMVHNLNIAELLDFPATGVLPLDLHPAINRVCTLLIELGLGHLNLGRNLTELSGGESQRLKLARFLGASEKSISNNQHHLLIILDEPCKGLSKNDCQFVLEVLQGLSRKGHSVLVIEHNDALIQQADYIIKMGPGVGDEGGLIVFEGPTSDYPTDGSILNGIKVKPITYSKDKSTHLTSEDRYFQKLSIYQKGALISQRDGKFFNTKAKLFEYLDDSACKPPYYFNPFCAELHTSATISKTQIKQRFESLVKLGLQKALVNNSLIKLTNAAKLVDYDTAWKTYIETDNPELAYNLGNGWIAVWKDDKTEILSTRLIDVDTRVVGARTLTRRTFNAFYNDCKLCNGSGKLTYYDSFISDEAKACTDLEFYSPSIRPYVKTKLLFKIRESVSFFKAENLADFSTPYRSLSSHERMALLHGIPNLSFTKRDGRKDALSDQIEWRGLIKLLESSSSLMPEFLKSSIETPRVSVNCYCCNGTGYAKEVDHYLVNGAPIYQCDPTEV